MNNKNCLIVGATGGLGLCLVKDFLSKGYSVFACGRNKDILKSIENPKCLTYYFDALAPIEQQYYYLKLIKDKIKKIDIFVYTAGIFKVNSLSKTSLNDVDNMYIVQDL